MWLRWWTELRPNWVGDMPVRCEKNKPQALSCGRYWPRFDAGAQQKIAHRFLDSYNHYYNTIFCVIIIVRSFSGAMEFRLWAALRR